MYFKTINAWKHTGFAIYELKYRLHFVVTIQQPAAVMAKETSENRFTFGHSSFCILLRKKNWISRRVFFFSRSLSIPSVGLSLSNYLSLNLPLVHSVIHSCSLCHTLLFTLSYKTYSGVFVCVFRFFYPHFFKFFFCWWSITWTKGEKKMEKHHFDIIWTWNTHRT